MPSATAAAAVSCSVIRDSELTCFACTFISSDLFVKGRLDRLRRSSELIRCRGAKHFFHAQRVPAVGNAITAFHYRYAVDAGGDKSGISSGITSPTCMLSI